ncbi:MAG: MBL fold metallo-hydrolase [Candidatus Marinimicrobia bacterium]|nr:MBL fold metallo-hydrolase [Candidatus Neomarinimicrobiota bacterium]
MLIKIVYDNTSVRSDLKSDWGFAAIIEYGGRKILFDAGADGDILLNNMRNMEIDPVTIDRVFISHHHFDHTGGLAAFLAKNNKVTLYAPESFRGVRNAARVIHVSETINIEKNIYSTGELKGIEQSLIIQTEMGVVLIVGCSHPSLKVIMQAAEPYGNIYAIVGGFHGFREFEILGDIRKICPTHCTQAIEELHKLYPEKYISGGAGKEIEL